MDYSRASIFKMVAELAAIMGRDSTITIALAFARIAAAGSEGVLQATVQRELNLSPAVLSRCAQTLSGLGLISRSIDSTDGRHHILRITDKGQAALSGGHAALTRNRTLSAHNLLSD